MNLNDMDPVNRQTTVSLAMGLIRHYKARYLAYREECAADARNGNRPRYCEHGTYLWTDHDPMCGGCEDGDSLGDPAFRRLVALGNAKDRVCEAKQICVVIDTAMQLRLTDAIDVKALMARTRELLTIES